MDYENTHHEAEIFYEGLGSIWCAALNDYVRFDKRGFVHLVKKGNKSRTKGERMRRFELLRYVPNILSRNAPISEERMVGNVRIKYWKFVDAREGVLVKVIIRQIKEGKKHFYSVYGKFKKPRPKA